MLHELAELFTYCCCKSSLLWISVGAHEMLHCSTCRQTGREASSLAFI